MLMEITKICQPLQIWLNTKKSNLTQSKTSNLLKDFAKVNSLGLDFLTPKAKEIFIHLRKAFIEALMLGYVDPERHIRFEIVVFEYLID